MDKQLQKFILFLSDLIGLKTGSRLCKESLPFLSMRLATEGLAGMIF